MTWTATFLAALRGASGLGQRCRPRTSPCSQAITADSSRPLTSAASIITTNAPRPGQDCGFRAILAERELHPRPAHLTAGQLPALSRARRHAREALEIPSDEVFGRDRYPSLQSRSEPLAEHRNRSRSRRMRFSVGTGPGAALAGQGQRKGTRYPPGPRQDQTTGECRG